MSETMTPTGYWAWEPEGKKISVQLQLDLIEKMSAIMLDGLGAVPKRGAEVGGILLGSFGEAESRVVRIDEFVPLPCSHKFGPSFVLTDEEIAALGVRLSELKAREADGPTVVGYYRSHTRDGLSLAGEDLQYCERHFQDPRQVVLLVRPSMMHVSRAAFFLYEDGLLQPATPLEFPFRRSELETGHAPPRRSLESSRMERRGYPAFQAEPKPSVVQMPGPGPGPGASPGPVNSSMPDAHAAAYAPPEVRSGRPPAGAQAPMGLGSIGAASAASPIPPAGGEGRIKRGWIWYPLSFIFLLLGVLLGFQGALSVNADKQGQPQVIQDPYSLSLNVSQTGDDLTLRWDRSNVAVRTAPRGLLDITDGKYTKRVDLNSEQLRTGSVIYQFSSNDVRFRLEIYPNERTVLSETAAWKQ